MPLKAVYTDLDGTMLGTGGSMFRDADGLFTLLPARALEACFRANVEVVIKSGRREVTVEPLARLLGQSSYIFEVGCGMVIDGEETLFVGDWEPRDGSTTYQLIEDSGAPRLLLEHFAGRLEYHTPWHTKREISHLMRGTISEAEGNELLLANGFDTLRLVDNGKVAPRPSLEGQPHAFHLIPAGASKANAVAAHMNARGYTAEDCIAVGDSKEDAEVASVVGHFFLVANGADDVAGPNVTRTEGRNGEGFYEAIMQSLVQR